MFHENWRAWTLFQQCATQWRRETVFASHMKKPVVVSYGLIYPAVESVFRMGGVRPKRRKRLFRKIQWIEAGALEGFSGREQGISRQKTAAWSWRPISEGEVYTENVYNQ